MNKVRKQVYLDLWQDEQLAEWSAKTGASEAEIIRQALDAYLLALAELPDEHPLSSLAGIGSSKQGGAGASDHDAILYRSP